MVRIRPFAAVRPTPSLAARVASVPYDVVNRDEAARLAEGNPYSFLHIVRSEIDLPECGPYDDAVYAAARDNLRRMLDEGVMVREDRPSLYLYRIVMDGRPQVGLVGSFHIDDYNNDLIKKHEGTRPEKEDDRTRHVLALGAQAGPVLMTYRDDDRFETLARHDMNTRPMFHFNAPDGVTHTVWKVEDSQPYVDLLGGVECLYVADGHHRTASAARATAERRAANPDHHGDEAYNWFLGALFPAGELNILAYNRFVKDPGGLDTAEILERLASIGTIEATGEKIPATPGAVHVYLDGGWHRFTVDPASIDTADPVASLDVAWLQDVVLEPLFGIADPRKDTRIEFIGGIRGPEELERRVDAVPGSVAFSMYPTSIEQLLDVADAGRHMPPKSTWFEPKLRSGLFVHEIDDRVDAPVA